ncbi:MAG: GNAT family N-acetyltransferase [Actinomycetota bacterium]
MKILETERLILREIVESDDKFMLDLLNQPSFIKYIGDRNIRNLEQAREFIESRYQKSYAENGFGLYAVELKSEFVKSAIENTLVHSQVSAIESKNQKPKTKSQIPIGICGFVRRDSLPEADIGFAFLPQFERKGYAFESANAVMKYGREKLNLKRVLAITSQDNESSGRLLEKLGFKFERLIAQPHDAEELKLFSSEAKK